MVWSTLFAEPTLADKVKITKKQLKFRLPTDRLSVEPSICHRRQMVHQYAPPATDPSQIDRAKICE
jgi:hypothetical protein